MTSEQKKIYNAIDEILYKDWDPIGITHVAPRDEYQSYTSTIFNLLNAGADIETIARKLHEIETSIIGTTGSIDHCRIIGEKIVNLR
jgi:hypothetical protein